MKLIFLIKDMIALFFLSIVTFCYLFYVLLKPEKF
ncbi:potassium-transporting ATPase subunit F [uncultured Pontibacter sp.]